MASSFTGPSFGSNFGALSIHSEILSADVPSDEQSKISLINELKARARVSVQSQMYPVAEKLYSKGIDVVNANSDDPSTSMKKEGSILYANRSLVHLNMLEKEMSLKDAEKAIELDPKYVKGYWRQGQALAALEQWYDAYQAFKKALVLEPKNKALKKELDRCEKMKAYGPTKKTTSTTQSVIQKAIEKSGHTGSQKKSTNTTKSSGSSDEKITVDDSSEFTESDHIRGYKMVGGKKTSFFHHEQTEEEKRLIGNIAPKRIDPSASAPIPSTSNNGSVSAWNKAGTWEEKDVTAWAKKALSSLLLASTYELPDTSPSPGSKARVTNVKKMDGHSSVATARGKKRYIYEFSFILEWEMTLPNEENDVKGSMTFHDIDGTCERGEYELSDYKVESKETPSSAKYVLERFVRNGGLRDEVIQNIDRFVDLFKDTYK